MWKPDKVELSLIENVQKKAANWITGAKTPHKDQLMKLNLLLFILIPRGTCRVVICRNSNGKS